MGKCVIGVDFGTLSARSLLVDAATGRELASYEAKYRHGVMDRALPCGDKLPAGWALQHPDDYLTCLKDSVRGALAASGVDPRDVIGIGVDFTACTMLAVNESLTPLCLLPEYAARPHAWVKLWKHHGAQWEADRMTEAARERGEPFLSRYGGKVSSEWMLPKIYETLRADPELYQRARFMEAGDWIVYRLCGRALRSSTMAGYKAFWHKKNGPPSPDYFKSVDPRLETVMTDKLVGPVAPVGTRAGGLTAQMASELGLMEGTAVSVCAVDAHVSLPGAGITQPGKLLMILGTSGCHILLDDKDVPVPGMCGAVEDGVVPGLIGYEAGQTCLGDHFNWFVEKCVPASYTRAAEEAGEGIHAHLTRLARALTPGESGLIALDWWNGNRSVLVDAELSGLILGLTLTTRPEEIYRALIEATAYGARVITDNFARHGVRVDEIYACGGVARKNAFLMQIYSDVLGREIRVVDSDQTSALGSAMLGAAAAGEDAGGYADIYQASRAMAPGPSAVYRPDPAAHAVYDELYHQYLRLHDLFGRGGLDTMKALKSIQRKAYSQR